MKDQIEKGAAAGKFEEVEAIEKQLVSEVRRLQEDCEAKKEKLRATFAKLAGQRAACPRTVRAGLALQRCVPTLSKAEASRFTKFRKIVRRVSEPDARRCGARESVRSYNAASEAAVQTLAALRSGASER